MLIHVVHVCGTYIIECVDACVHDHTRMPEKVLSVQIFHCLPSPCRQGLSLKTELGWWLVNPTDRVPFLPSTRATSNYGHTWLPWCVLEI